MQTAVEWYKKEVVELAFQLQHQKIDLYEFLVEIKKREEQAKEMEKKQSLELIKLASELTGVATVDKDIAKMEYIDVYNQYYKQQTDENGKPLTYWGGVDFTNPNAHLIKSSSTTSSQTEISDDVLKKILEDINKQPMTFVPNEISDKEIEESSPYKLGSGNYNPLANFHRYEGAKWYREQLKNK